MSSENEAELLSIDGRAVRVTHPDKPYFSSGAKLSKLDLVRYYLSVAPGALAGICNRPIVLKRFVNGAAGEVFYQKRAPTSRPQWLRTVTLSFPSGRKAEEVVVDDAAGLAWIVNLGCIELHPHPVRSNDLQHPDELRVDLDPGPGVAWDDVRRVSLEVKSLLDEMGLHGWPKTSGSRGMHVNVRIQQSWTFTEVRRAAIALSREIERRAGIGDFKVVEGGASWRVPRLQPERKRPHHLFCVLCTPAADARVSTPLRWDEVADCDPADFTVLTVPKRFAEFGDPHQAMDAQPGSLEKLLELAAKDEAEGLGDAPWPPHFRKSEGEATRVAPSRARSSAKKSTAKKPRTRMPLLVVANSPKKDLALEGLERWKTRNPKAAKLLAVDDVLIDTMRGRSSTWTRIRVNLRNVPEASRPAQETPDPDDDPTREWREHWALRRPKKANNT